MSYTITLPRLGFAMEEGKVVEWFAKDGEHIEAGAPMFSLESEKSVTEIEAPTSGTLSIKVAASDEIYPVGTELGLID
jgi:pyruvate/2-oxoglutarate dehydrogenase complex dihydrolipoamide acyltransferase (E2) component